MRKLTDSDKQEILKLYRETAETTSTLAERYEVSNSTISRLLKSTLPEDEYEYLVSLKRAARTPEGRAQVSYDQVQANITPQKDKEVKQIEVKATPKEESFPPELPKTSLPSPRNAPPKVKVVQPPLPVVEAQPYEEDETDEEAAANRRVRRRSSAPTPIPRQVVGEQLELLEQKPTVITNIPSPMLEGEPPNPTVIAQMLGEDLLDESEDLDDLDDDLDDDDDDFDEEDEEDDDFEDSRPLVTRRANGSVAVQVLPLSAAHLPKTCYLVIDRSSELITRPLKDFGDLGQIPTIETQQRTLPIFDNHRVAKRFSTKRDRVIKVPDSKMLHKARTHLQAKGITRLLIDGQVYSLSTV
ncbi:transposase [Plectonema radiosum NIES-515]|uniref:Transposase n=1 Tax=Plectonema radiosum NIES-515 TaxID=2986073 RepID=A0ABT3AY87_9CYAN|nr:transposase [Plectonema radiosum]MCV3214088.1 transposase [Plectonema radiosum NIES-515]